MVVPDRAAFEESMEVLEGTALVVSVLVPVRAAEAVSMVVKEKLAVKDS